MGHGYIPISLANELRSPICVQCRYSRLVDIATRSLVGQETQLEQRACVGSRPEMLLMVSIHALLQQSTTQGIDLS